ncbi:hypothetical protein IMCC26134_07290 [Verrucomicrobia bacterium IMCC26134]|nr:hypothetical protein IMCC26134_07290 [Verrucomicrobia bacterium IMCC26134]
MSKGAFTMDFTETRGRTIYAKVISVEADAVKIRREWRGIKTRNRDPGQGAAQDHGAEGDT